MLKPTRVLKYRKKPVEIEALRTQLGMDINKIIDFVGTENFKQNEHGTIFIKTLEGEMKVTPSDYIIKGIQGEFYPCKADIFLQTYEEL